MPRDTGEAVLRISTTGLRRYERLIQIDARDVAKLLNELVDLMGESAVNQLQTAAPKDTGHLRRNIRVTGKNRSTTKPNVRVGVDVHSDSGFPYVNVTRFGRKAVNVRESRKARDLPVSSPARTYSGTQIGGAGGRPPHRAHALKVDLPDGILFRHSVRAWHPKKDWVRVAEPRINAQANELLEEVGDEMERLLARGSVRGTLGATRIATTKVFSRTGR
jgi:hypothetical protein